MLKYYKIHKHLNLPAILFVLLALITGICIPAVCRAQDQSVNNTIRKPLEGGVELDEKLPSLPDDYQVGGRVDLEQLTALTPNNLWYPIPNWFGGKWHSESMTVTRVQDCDSGKTEKVNVVRKEIADVDHGQQRDKTGQIWEFIQIPRVVKVVVDAGTCYLTCSRQDIIQSDPSGVVFKALTSQITVDKKQKVVASEQVQQISRSRLIDEGMVQVEGTLKNFSATGDPEQIQTVEKVIHRTAPYQDIDTRDGLNLKQLFIEFLKKTGRENLVPTGQ
jgi:hypothetical protein